MREILNIPIGEVIPSIEAILNGQGIPRHVKPDERTIRIAEDAISIYKQKGTPAGILMEISKEDFGTIYTGDGQNESKSPVKPIYLTSDHLTLFAVTTGEDVCSEIATLFQTNDFALGSMLDTAASEAAEMAAQFLESYYHRHLTEIDRFHPGTGVLRFSPGYCGWHISAQRKLFQHLKPEDIGIILNDSFLMQPLKSVSGIIISGRKEIFKFDDTFSFCRDCTTHTCRDRLKAVLEQQ